MKLVVNRCNNCGKKLYLNISASSRSDLRYKLRSNEFYLTCGNCHYQNIYTVDQVRAEAETNSTLAGSVVGGIIGLIGGPIGAVIGGGIGAAIGNSSDESERNRVNFFNHSN